MILSPHLEALLGYPTRGFDGASQTFLGRLLPADRVRVEAAIGAVAATGNETDLEFRVIDVSGVARWLSARGRVLRDAVGQPIRLVGTMQEMPAPVVTERRMRRQQAGLLQLLAEDRITQIPVDEALPLHHRGRRAHARDRAHQRVAVRRVADADPLSQPLPAQPRVSTWPAPRSRRARFPAYFRALESGRAVAASDAHRDPRTVELAADYLAPLGIDVDAGGPDPPRRAPSRRGLPRARRPGAAVAARREELRGVDRRPRRRWRSTPASGRGSPTRLAQSEERYRTFVESLDRGDPARRHLAAGVARGAARRAGGARPPSRRVAECNASLAKLLARQSTAAPVRPHARVAGAARRRRAVLTDWIASGTASASTRSTSSASTARPCGCSARWSA